MQQKIKKEVGGIKGKERRHEGKGKRRRREREKSVKRG